jgi:thioredoxin-like negative regulator of GroEL
MKPTVTVFSAGWCQPCQKFKPIIKQVYESNPNAFYLSVVDIDEEPELTKAHDVRGIPTVMLHHKDDVKVNVGAMTKSELLVFLTNGGIEC